LAEALWVPVSHKIQQLFSVVGQKDQGYYAVEDTFFHQNNKSKKHIQPNSVFSAEVP